MTISAMQAAKFLCERSNGELTQLKLHKTLYIAHLLYLGEHNEPLINESFQAWAYGPVVKELYNKLKFLGSSPIPCEYFDSTRDIDEQGKEAKLLTEVIDKVKNIPASRLVAITHREEGAWAKNYSQYNWNKQISNEDILKEYSTL